MHVELGDGLDGLLALEAGSVDLILSDLPSGETAAEFDVKPNLTEFWDSVWSALKPTGQAVLMASSLKFAAELMRSADYNTFRYDLVWEKSLAVGFLNSKNRPLRAHEFVLVFSRKQGTYNPQMVRGTTPISSNRAMKSRERSTERITENYGSGKSKLGVARENELDRFPRSVLHYGSIPTRTKERIHPQQKPADLLRMLVRQYSNPGELVVDPFAGSGSTLAAAEAEGRQALGWDSSERFGVNATG